MRQGRVPGTPRVRLGYVSGTRQEALLYMPKTVLLYGSLVLADSLTMYSAACIYAKAMHGTVVITVLVTICVKNFVFVFGIVRTAEQPKNGWTGTPD